ncbi:MAG: hypothetical protein MRY83_11725 [Flavobacteriales bacterium]|nr:hypothetical protein [Flavobacteriales bacterium]
MKILILCPNYYPIENPRAFRWQALANHWAKDHEVTVICAQSTGAKKEEIRNGVHICRKGYNNMMDLVYHLLKVKTRRDRQIGNQKGKKKSKGVLEKWMAIFNQLFWHSIYWPDGSCIWYLPAIRMAKQLIKKRQFDAIITVSLPFSAHLVGLQLKKKYPQIKWLVDIGDPFALHDIAPRNNEFFYKQLNYRIETKVLKKCDHIFFTHSEAQKAYVEAFFDLSHKSSITPPLVPGYQPFSQEEILFSEQKIHLAYFGSFYPNIRSPLPLLKLMDTLFQQDHPLLEKLKFHFVGFISAEMQNIFSHFNHLSPFIICHGFQPKALMSRYLRQTNILINIANTTRFQLPSKLPEYLQAGHPIINISTIQNDPFATALTKHPIAINIVLDDTIISLQQAEEFVTFVKSNAGQKLSQSQKTKLLAPYQLENVSTTYLLPIKKG